MPEDAAGRENEYARQLRADQQSARSGLFFSEPSKRARVAALGLSLATGEQMEDRYQLDPRSENAIFEQYREEDGAFGQPQDAWSVGGKNFQLAQQQARIQAGVNLPEYLPSDAGSMNDPQYSTEDNPVSYNDTLADLQAQNAATNDPVEALRLRNEFQDTIGDAVESRENALAGFAKEKISRWIATSSGGISDAIGSTGLDAGVLTTANFFYSVLGRGAVTVLMPKTDGEDGVQQAVHTVLPTYENKHIVDKGLNLVLPIILFGLGLTVIAFIVATLLGLAWPMLDPLSFLKFVGESTTN